MLYTHNNTTNIWQIQFLTQEVSLTTYFLNYFYKSKGAWTGDSDSRYLSHSKVYYIYANDMPFVPASNLNLSLLY